MSELWVAAVGAVGAAVVTGYATQAGANAAGHGGAPAARNLGNEIGSINQQLGGATGDPSANSLNGLQTIVGGNIDVPAFLQQHPEFQEGYDNNEGHDQAAWLRSAINNATYLDQSTIPRTGGIGTLQNTLNSQNRAGNLLDAANGAGAYNQIIRQANPEYYAALANYNTAANAPVVPGDAQVAAQANALRGYSSPLSGALNTQAMGMARPLQSWGGTTGTPPPPPPTGGFRSGGYTGNGARNQPAGIVHRGEYVIPAPAVARIGLPTLNRMALPGYASGGLVGGGAIEGDPSLGGTVDGAGGMGDFTTSAGGTDFGFMGGSNGNMGTAPGVSLGGGTPTGNLSGDVINNPQSPVPGKPAVDGGDGFTPPPLDKDGNPMIATRGTTLASTNGSGDLTPTQGTTSDQGVNMTGNPGATTNTTTATTASGSDPNYWGGSALGFSDLQNQQNRIGMGLLQQGGNLSASDLRNVQQASRGGFAARGLDGTNASVVDETFNTDAARRARLLQNLSTAQGIQNQGLAETTNQQNFGLNLNSQYLQSQGLQNQALNQSAALAEQQREFQLQQQGNAANLYAGSRVDPYAAIIGGTNQNNLSNALGLYGQVNPSANALYGYGSDLNNTNYNAQAAANISGANNQAALYGAGINAAGRIGQSYFQNQGSTTPPPAPTNYDNLF